MIEIMKKKIKYFEPESYQDCISISCPMSVNGSCHECDFYQDCISISCPNCVFYDEKRKTVLDCIEYIKFTKFKKNKITYL